MRARSVFLSYNRKDKGSVAVLAQKLEEQGIEFWRDEDKLRPGEDWIPEIQKAIAACSAAAIFYGPSGPGTWQQQEEQMALRRSVNAPAEFNVIPVLLPGGEIPKESILGNRTWVEFPDLHDRGALSRLIWGIDGIVPPPPPPLDVECPYRGLGVFEIQHARFFFGRDKEKSEILGRVRDMLKDAEQVRLYGVLGGSGSGKSSLMRAGLLNQLENGMVPSSANWRIFDFLPGSEPIKMLALQILKLEGGGGTGSRLTELMREFQHDSKMLDRSVAAALNGQPDQRAVFFVDQLEEVFLSPREEREAFFDNLLFAATNRAGQTVVLFTLRVDFYSNCAENLKLAELIPSHHLLLGPLEPPQLRQAIGGPARAVGCELEPALIEVLIDESGNEPGNLPLLEFVLLELWKSRQGELLTLAAYEKIGRLHGALDRHAEKIYTDMTQAQRAICRTLFLQLAQPWREDRFTRRRVTLRELLARKPDADATQSIEEVLNILAGPDSRLITIRTPDHGTNQVDIDLAHETLLTGWERLSTWLKEERDFLDWRQRIGIAIKDWVHFNRDSECLLHGTRLDEARAKRDERGDELTTEETHYIQASLEFRTSQRLRRVLLIAGQAALSLAFIGLAALWMDRRLKLLETTRQAIDAKSPCAVVYALSAHRLRWKSITKFDGFGETETHQLLEEAVQGASAPLIEPDNSDDIGDVRFSPDGRYVATASYDRTVTLSASDGRMIFTSDPMPGPVLALAFTSSSDLVAAGDQTGHVQVFRTSSTYPAFALPAQTEAITALEFVPGGNSLLLGSVRGKLFLFDGQAVRLFAQGHQGEITAIAISPDHKRFATASKDGTAKLWSLDADTGQVLPVPPNTVTMDTIAFASGHIFGGTLFGKGAVHEWDPKGMQHWFMPVVADLNGMAVSLDGSTLATSEPPPDLTKTGSTIHIWSTQSLGRANLTIEYPDKDLRKLALSSDGSRLALATPRTVLVYELSDVPLEAAAKQIIERDKARESQKPNLLNDCRALLP